MLSKYGLDEVLGLLEEILATPTPSSHRRRTHPGSARGYGNVPGWLRDARSGCHRMDAGGRGNASSAAESDAHSGSIGDRDGLALSLTPRESRRVDGPWGTRLVRLCGSLTVTEYSQGGRDRLLVDFGCVFPVF